MESKHEVPIKKYEEFRGSILTQMPLLVAQGLVPINVSQSMEQRLAYIYGPATNKNAKTGLINEQHRTGDAILYHPNGDVKVVLDCSILREINEKSLRGRFFGELIIEKDVYRALHGEVLREENFQCSTDLSQRQVLSHPLWQILARDKKLLNDYTDFIFAAPDDVTNYSFDEHKMGVYRPHPNSYGKPLMHLLTFDYTFSSRLYIGSDGVDDCRGRLLALNNFF